MRLSATSRYPADATQVAIMLADPEFVAAKVRASGAISQSVAVVGTPDHAFTVTTRRQMPTSGIPAQFRSLVGPSLEVRQVEAWEPPAAGERQGTIVVEIVGAPVRLTGSLRLVPNDDDTTTSHIDAELRATMPLFSSVIENATAQAIRATIEAEERTAVAWLAE